MDRRTTVYLVRHAESQPSVEVPEPKPTTVVASSPSTPVIAVIDRAMLTDVKAVRAHVHNGQIVLDESVELLEGVAVEVLLPDTGDLATEERDELDAEVEESATQFARGEFEDARAFARKLAAKS